MNKIYYKFVLVTLVYVTLMFAVWSLIAGLANAREMLFVLAVLAASLAGKGAIKQAYVLGAGQNKTS
ncbi:hypothetical protein [Salinimonas lutimaris]|uniref:hypothetical protein n=1 Tax=Salinimonas lutimaris TaxID=914153 RepID=UPI0010C118EE|nr:hypothetical protein [Salinimonas lutimaris]